MPLSKDDEEVGEEAPCDGPPGGARSARRVAKTQLERLTGTLAVEGDRRRPGSRSAPVTGRASSAFCLPPYTQARGASRGVAPCALVALPI